MRLAPVVAAVTLTTIAAAPAAATGVSAGVAGAVTATGTSFFRPTHGMVLDATCAFSVLGALDGDLHVQVTGAAVAAAHQPVASTSLTCTVYDAHGNSGSRTATAGDASVALLPRVTLAGPAPFRVCVSATSTGTTPVAVTIRETCAAAPAT